MRRIPLALALTLLGCSAAEPPRQVRAPTAALPAAQEPAPPPAMPAAAAEPDPRPLPSSIVLGASLTRQGDGDRPPVTVRLGGGKPVEWTRTEIRSDAGPFDIRAIRATTTSSDLWERAIGEPGTVRVCCRISGLPPDALFLELDRKSSDVLWTDGTFGSFRRIWSQSRVDGGWSLDVLTTVPPADPAIQSLRIALDLHRATRLQRSESALAVGDSAFFDFGISRTQWTLSADLVVTEFAVGGGGEPLVRLFDRGLTPRKLVRLADAEGRPLKEMMESGSGSTVITEWSRGFGLDLAPPVHVTVDAPLETTTSRVVVNLKDIHPK